MKTCSKCKQDKPFDLFSKNKREKDGYQFHCKECKLAYQRANKNRKEVVAKYREANKDLCNARSVVAQRKKPEYYAEKMRKWIEQNKEKHLAQRRAWRKANNAFETERKRRRANRIKNADLLNKAERAEIQGFYDFCSIFKGFEVDHIVPLNGATVSGMHVPWNLQVLPISVNRSKGNKFVANATA